MEAKIEKEPEKAPEAPAPNPKPDPKPAESQNSIPENPTPIVNPRITSVLSQILSKDGLVKLAEKYRKLTISIPAAEKAKDNKWFERVDVKNRICLDEGGQHTIDVQPDMRFPLSYIMHYIASIYSSIDVKATPQASLFSLIAYLEISITAILLCTDITIRELTSFYANAYVTDAERKDFYRLLLQTYIPADIAILIEHISTVTDPRRPLMEFIPSFAGAKFAQDFGRLPPPHIFIIMHNLLSKTRPNQLQAEIMRQFYNTLVITVHNLEYRVTHFLGGYFLNGQNTNNHDNWLNILVETVFNPTVSRLHSQRPTLAPIPLTPLVELGTDVNYYDFMLAYTPENYLGLKSMMNQCSAFFQDNIPGSIPLANVLEKIGGITLLNHTIEPATLPTWHFLAPPNACIAAEPAPMTDSNFATHCNFMTTGPEPRSLVPYPPDVPADAWRPDLYNVRNVPYDPNNPNYTFKTFHHKRDVRPDVLMMMPYERNLTRATIAQTLGIKIESEELSGMIIPLPDPEISLHMNNSCYVQGSVPEVNVMPTLMSRVVNHRIRIVQRNPENQNLANGYMFRDAARVVVPYYAHENCEADINRIPGCTYESNHNDRYRSYTATAWIHGDQSQLGLPRRRLHLWSSYRYVEHSNRATRLVNLYYTMRQFHGLGEILSRTTNPATAMYI